MILVLWRLFRRFVVGLPPAAVTCVDPECWERRSPICLKARCRGHCGDHCPKTVDYKGTRCEFALTSEEVDLLARYRGDTKRLTEVRQ